MFLHVLKEYVRFFAEYFGGDNGFVSIHTGFVFGVSARRYSDGAEAVGVSINANVTTLVRHDAAKTNTGYLLPNWLLEILSEPLQRTFPV